MAIFEWRKFNFFDLKKNVDDGKVAEQIKDATITCATNGNNQICICDSLGFVHVFKRNWEAITFRAHEGQIYFCEIAEQHNLLVTIGVDNNNGTGGTTTTTNEENDIPNNHILLYKVWNLARIKNGISICVRMAKITTQKPTSLAVSSNGQYMAIGYDRGSITLYRGDISRGSKNFKTLSGGTTSITGIAFKQIGKLMQMFVCSDSGILVYNLHGKDKETKIILDKTCAPARCCVLQMNQALNDAHFMVGRDDAVYCYTVDGRGPCYALDGQKLLIQWFRSHLLTVSKPTKNTMSSQKDSILTIIDIQNKFIVFSSPMDNTAAILVEFGTCFIITANKEVYHLDEKDLQTKLNLLFKKNLYDIAVRIAKSNQYDTEGLAEIFRQYGDHLYSKGDFAGSVDQYTKTIGYLEPSYIIRRFLDSRHINYLTDYLQALHKQGEATADHTTLLLNCFTRLDKTDQLKEFLGNDKNPDINFDLDVAIKVCRNASVEHALSLAKRNQKHDLCLSILTEDLQLYKDALDYISNLPFSDAEENLKKYGNILMEHCPDELTGLLKKICTNYRDQSIRMIAGEQDNEFLLDLNSHTNINRSSVEDFIHLFVNSTDRLIDFLEHLIANLTNCSQLVYNTLIEHYLYRWKTDKTIETKLMEILQINQDVYDQNHVLLLCSTYGFSSGIMLIYEEQKLYHLIVRYHLKNKDYNSLLSCCKRLGSIQPSLWLQALTGLREDKEVPVNLLPQILQVIANEKLQSPLQILNCLAVENGPNLSTVREYFLQVFQKENETTKQEENLVIRYRNDSNTLKKHIKNLQENPVEFKGTICDTCNQPLSMPAIYFLCQHSYHQDCVRGYSENDKDCPVCHSKNLQLIDALRAQSESRGQHEMFHNLLDRSQEPFSVVAEYFGRGLFNKIVIVEENDTQIEINKNTIENPTRQPPYHNVNKPTTIQSYSSTTSSTSKTISNTSYGTGAEAKLRLDEGKLKGRNSVQNKIPIPEGRMRLQESKYSTSLEANITRIDERDNRSPKITPSSSPKITTHNVINRSSNLISKNIVNEAAKTKATSSTTAKTTASTNPFDEDDDDDGYDVLKNPFAEDCEEATDISEEQFGRKYDNNLNPFY